MADKYKEEVLIEIVTDILRAGGFAIGTPRVEDTTRKWAILIVYALRETDNRYIEELLDNGGQR